MAHFAGIMVAIVGMSGSDSPVDEASSAVSAQAPRAQAVQRSHQAENDVEVWIDLAAPPLSTLSPDERDARAALRARIEKQQDDVMSQLASLGAEERARVVEVRNAIAVKLPSSALSQARAIPGVVKVRVVKHRKQTP